MIVVVLRLHNFELLAIALQLRQLKAAKMKDYSTDTAAPL